jgi:hypothetical protein
MRTRRGTCLGLSERMVDTAVQLRERREEARGEPVGVHDVEKTYLMLRDLISDSGFDHLIED